jgi:hypothetical protein
MGLKVIRAGRVDPAVEGVEGQHWVRAEDLPVYSESNCEKYLPYQRKKFAYDFNKQGIITWVRYNA